MKNFKDILAEAKNKGTPAKHKHKVGSTVAYVGDGKEIVTIHSHEPPVGDGKNPHYVVQRHGTRNPTKHGERWYAFEHELRGLGKLNKD